MGVAPTLLIQKENVSFFTSNTTVSLPRNFHDMKGLAVDFKMPCPSLLVMDRALAGFFTFQVTEYLQI